MSRQWQSSVRQGPGRRPSSHNVRAVPQWRLLPEAELGRVLALYVLWRAEQATDPLTQQRRE